MNSDELLARVVENALDFLERSLDDFEIKPKYSVIHFHAGVELLLKARLMAEHWSLVVSRRQEPDRKRLESGDFISATLDEAANRLEKVVGSGLTDRELRVFQSLAQHRNRMVHFFHDIGSREAAGALLRNVASEQLIAWYLLSRLLSEQWSETFSPWQKQLEAFGGRLRKHEQFLQIAFSNITPEIQKRAQEGASFRECPSCGFAALQLEEEIGNLFEGTCLVCTFNERSLGIQCPDCSEQVTLCGSGFGKCQECGRQFEPPEVARLIDDGERGSKGYFDSGMPAHCRDCDGYEVVVAHGGQFVCVSCFTTYDDDELHPCDWCGDLNAGDVEDSSWSGCIACEGRAGHYAGQND